MVTGISLYRVSVLLLKYLIQVLDPPLLVAMKTCRRAHSFLAILETTAHSIQTIEQASRKHEG